MDGRRLPCARCRELEAQVAALQRRVGELTAQVERLTAALAAAQRAGKRQAAPFRKADGPKPAPKPPGRKAGEEHGPHAHRAAPPTIDEHYDAPLPRRCPHCGGRHLSESHTATQYQTEIVRRAVHREFTVHLGTCCDCGASVQGRHPLQTSDALGAAAHHLGGDAHAALALLNKELGLSHGKCAKLLGTLFGIRIARATSARSILRTARQTRPAYERLRQDIRGSPWVVPDETGWRVGGKNAWLHVFVGENGTCYDIGNRSGELAERLLGADWSGTLIHDGWAVYDGFTTARHQQCLAHLLRRCRELLETATRGAVRFPRAVHATLRHALLLRDRRDAGQLSPHGLAVATGRLRERLWRLIEERKRNPANERLAEHLGKHFEQLFTFLELPGLDATNWRAEQALRPAVVNRKVWGGNRTPAGADAQSILTSLIVTLAQRRHDALSWLSTARRASTPLALPA
jgi:transposase